MDSEQCLDDVPFPLRFDRIYAPHLLETKVLSHEPDLPFRIHSDGGILHFSHNVLLRQQDRDRGSRVHAWHLRCSDAICMPVQVRLHLMDAVPLWISLGTHHFRLHGGILPIQQQG